MEDEFAPIPLNENKANPDIKPVKYKPLSDNPEERSEQLNKISNSVSKIVEHINQNNFSEISDNYFKLHYYIRSLGPEDRFDILRQLDQKELITPNTIPLVTSDLYIRDELKDKFPKIEESIKFPIEKFKEVIDILERSNNQYLVGPSSFEKSDSDDFVKYFLRNTYDRNYLFQESQTYFGITPTELIKKYYEVLKEPKKENDDVVNLFSSDFHTDSNNLNSLSSVINKFSNHISYKGKENPEIKENYSREIKTMLEFFFQELENNNQKHGTDTLDKYILQNLYGCFREIVPHYNNFGYEYDSLISQLKILGPNFISSLLKDANEADKQKLFQSSLDIYQEFLVESRNIPKITFLNNEDICNPVQALFSLDIQNLDKYDLNSIFSFMNTNSDIDPGENYYKTAANSTEIDKYLEFRKDKDNEYLYHRLLNNLKNLTIEEKRILSKKLNPNYIRDFLKLGYTVDEILDIIESDPSQSINYIISESRDKFSPEQLLRAMKASIDKKEYSAYFEIVFFTEINLDDSQKEDVKNTILKFINENAYLYSMLSKAISESNLEIFDFKFITQLAKSTKFLDVTNAEIILNSKDKIKDFNQEEFINLILSNGNILTIYNLFYKDKENANQEFKKFISSKLDIISVENIESIFDRPEISDSERLQIIKSRVFPSPTILNYMLKNFEKGIIPNNLYSEYFEAIKKVAQEKDETSRVDLAYDIAQGISDIFNKSENFSDPIFKEFLKFYAQLIHTDVKLVDYKSSDLKSRIGLYYNLPTKFLDGLNLSFEQKMLEAISKIPSSMLLEKSAKILTNSLPTKNPETGEFTDPKDLYLFENLEKTYNQFGKNIPLNIFSQIYFDSDNNTDLISKFNEIYSQKIGKEASDSLAYLIITAYETRNPVIKEVLINNIFKLNYKDKSKVSEDLKTLRILLVIDSIEELNEESAKVFKDKLSEFTPDYADKCKDYILTNLDSIFPNIPRDTMSSVLDFYPDIEPFFTYIKGLKGNIQKGEHGSEILNYLDEIIENLSPGDIQKWKEWRYDRKNPTVEHQLHGLSDQELQIWSQDRIVNLSDYYSEIGIYDPFITESKIEIINFIKQIVESSERLSTNPYVSSILKQLVEFESNKYNEDSFNDLINKILDSINDVLKNTRIIQGYQNIEKIGTYLNSLISSKENIALTSNELQRMEKFFGSVLTKDDIEIIKNNFEKEKQNSTNKNAAGVQTANLDNVIPTELQSKINKYVTLAETRYNQSKSAIENLELSTETQSIRSLGKDLDFVIDLCNLLTINTNEIKAQKFSRDNSSKELSTVISNVTNYYKLESSGVLNSTLTDLLSRADTGPSKTEVAVLITDNPYLLFNIGKYPIGSGSCQNYENPGLNKTLLGYVGDASTKAVFVLQTNKLSPQIQELIRNGGIESLINTPFEAELLPAIIGRSVIKLGTAVETNESGEDQEFPAVYIEPVYTIANKGDRSLNLLIQDSVISGYAKEIGLGVYTGAGSSTIKISASRNPEGQYEDGAMGGAQHGGMGRQSYDYDLVGERIY